MRKMCCAVIAALAVLAAVSCERMGNGGGYGELCVSFGGGEALLTRSYLNLPDTSGFRLTVRSSSGKTVYEGLYGDCPESLSVAPGSYDIKVVSGDFSKPAFDSPHFGDEQCVIVPDNGRVNVRLECTQLNAGVRLRISPAFLTACPDEVLFLKSDSGKLMYSYSEKRTAYFSPGRVSLVKSGPAGEETLVVRELMARDMLSIGVGVAGSSEADRSGGMSISIDTARVWHQEEFVIGGAGAGSDEDNAMTVAQARMAPGEEDVWVCGYIVGGDLTSASASFSAPFESRTNILLGPRSSTVDKSACISVQLPQGDVRESLNLVDNPGLLGSRVCLKGDVVEAYYGVPGMKNTSDYVIL